MVNSSEVHTLTFFENSKARIAKKIAKSNPQNKVPTDPDVNLGDCGSNNLRINETNVSLERLSQYFEISLN